MSSPAPSANTIACTQCGGENELASGRRLFRCQYCDATLFVDRGGVVNHYRLPPLLGADEARSTPVTGCSFREASPGGAADAAK